MRVIRGGPAGEHLGATVVERSRIDVCGRPAERLVVRIAAFEAVPAFMDDEGTVSHGKPVRAPERIEIRIRFTAGSQAVSVEWSVEASRRDHYRRAERAFLASIRCFDTSPPWSAMHRVTSSTAPATRSIRGSVAAG
jgi:hypothetical protein